MSAVTLNDVIVATCEALSMTKSTLLSKSRKKPLVRARYAAMYIMLKDVKPAPSLKMVGKAFGSMDHSMVIYGRDTIESEIGRYDDVRARIDGIRALLRPRFPV